MALPPPPRILLVEGQDDKHVVRHIRDRHENMPEFHIKAMDGVDNLLRSLKLEVKQAMREVVGIMLDANSDPASRWQSLSDRLGDEHFRLPDRIPKTGAIITGEPRIGIWLMPNNQTSGQLEDFVATLIPAGDPVWPLAEKYIDGIPAQHKPKSDSKAKVHAWLATRDEPQQMGAAIGTGDLQATEPLALHFADWLRKLFA